jgi:hypothetical protein
MGGGGGGAAAGTADAGTGGGFCGGWGAGGGLPSDGSQLGMSGLSPPWPPFALEVPTSAALLDSVYAAQRPLRP